MSEPHGIIARVKARARAILPSDWLGKAGASFRRTIETISEFSRERIRPADRVREAPDLLWEYAKGSATEKQSRVLVNFQDEESKRIDNALQRRTADDKARQEKANADKLESEARTAKVKELEAKLALVDRLRSIGVVPVWDKEGNMTVLKAPLDYDWDGLTRALLGSAELRSLDKSEPDEDTLEPE